MKRLLIVITFTILAVSTYAQLPSTDLNLPMTALLQYIGQKSRRTDAIAPFRRYGLRHIRAVSYMREGDPRQLWGFRVKANTEWTQQSQPLYRLFDKTNYSSIAVIDGASGWTSCQVVFWAKRYYRRYAAALRQMGFTMRESPTQQNVLQFRRPDTSVGVDFIIWEDIYVMEVKAL